MKKGYLIIGILALIVMFGGCSYNSMNRARLGADQKWADVQGAYQRRYDLIPNLVATVKGAADFEKSTLEAVTQARANATSLKIDAKDLTPEKLQEIQQSQNQISQAIGRLLMVSEQYPQLRATESFRDLQVQLEGTENRINESRRQFNESVKDYNEKVTSFPNNLLAGIFSFKPRPMFEADQSAQKAPTVKF